MALKAQMAIWALGHPQSWISVGVCRGSGRPTRYPLELHLFPRNRAPTALQFRPLERSALRDWSGGGSAAVAVASGLFAGLFWPARRPAAMQRVRCLFCRLWSAVSRGYGGTVAPHVVQPCASPRRYRVRSQDDASPQLPAGERPWTVTSAELVWGSAGACHACASPTCPPLWTLFPDGFGSGRAAA